MKKRMIGLFTAFIVVLYVLLALAIMKQPSFAATVTKTFTGTWTYPTAEESKILGFRVFDQTGKVIIDNIAPNLRTATAQITYDDAAIQVYTMVAFGSDNRQSNPSNAIIMKPALQVIQGVGTFEFKVQ